MASKSGSGSGSQPKSSSNRPAGTGSGSSAKSGSAAPAKPISDYAIHKSWGGKMNFMHSHGLRMWNPEDHDTARQITAEIRHDMANDAAATTKAGSGGGSTAKR